MKNIKITLLPPILLYNKISQIIDFSAFSKKAENEVIDGSKEWTNKVLKMTNLLTSDPQVVGQLWN